MGNHLERVALRQPMSSQCHIFPHIKQVLTQIQLLSHPPSEDSLFYNLRQQFYLHIRPPHNLTIDLVVKFCAAQFAKCSLDVSQDQAAVADNHYSTASRSIDPSQLTGAQEKTLR
eukprot:580103-Hanusia_phi.AAC.5